MKNKNIVSQNNCIEKPHKEKKRQKNPMIPPKQNLDGTNRFAFTSISRKKI